MNLLRNCVLENFPFIEDDFDALTDYELFSKALNYIKNYQKEFDRIEQEIKDFEQYISTIDIVKTVNEVLTEVLPQFSDEILSEVNLRLIALNDNINNTINDLSDDINNSLNDINNEIDSIKDGNIEVYNPTNGETESLNTTLQDIVNMLLNTIPTAITCLEYDNLELTASDFDNYELTAIEFDLNSKELLV